MKETTIPQECLALDETTEKVAKAVAAAQSLIQSRNYDLAERQLVNLQTDFPNVSVVYDLLGNVSYLRRDFPEALRFYRKSLSISPGNPETSRMVDKLSRISGQRIPAEEGR
jgi:TolA-binding protein